MSILDEILNEVLCEDKEVIEERIIKVRHL